MWYHFPVSLSETCNRIHVFIFGFVYNDDNSIQLVKKYSQVSRRIQEEMLSKAKNLTSCKKQYSSYILHS